MTMQDLINFLSNHLTLTIAVIIVLAFVMIVEFIRTKRNSLGLSPLQATQMMNHDNAIVLDIRASELYRKGHIIEAYSSTPQEINANPKKLEKFRTRPLIIVCSTGVESQKIAALLLKQGYNVYALTGGMRSWTDAQMPIVKE